MSLLMDALKQQQTPAAMPVAPVASGFWRTLALTLLVLVGVATGFALTYWLGQHQPKALSAAQELAAGAASLDSSTNSSAAQGSTTNSDTANSNTTNNTTAAGQVAIKSAAGSSLPPAHPGLILSDLLTVPATAAVEEQLVISGERRQDQFTELPSMQEAISDTPVDELAASPYEPAAELSADQVSDTLRQKFQYAIEATNQSVRKPQVTEHAAPARDVRSLDDLLQRQIPPLRFEAHIYASEPKKRWVKVNGKDLQEGQWITADIQLKEITANYVLLQTGRQLFSMEALSEWSYRLPPNR